MIFVSYEKGRLRREAQALLGERFWRTPSLLAALLQAKAIAAEDLDAVLALSGLAALNGDNSWARQFKHLSRLVDEARRLIAVGEDPVA